jgi:hypothetical protein
MAYSLLKVQKFVLNRVYSENGNTSLAKTTRAQNHPSIYKQHLQSMLGYKHINFLAPVRLSRHMFSIHSITKCEQLFADVEGYGSKTSVPRVRSHTYISWMESVLWSELSFSAICYDVHGNVILVFWTNPSGFSHDNFILIHPIVLYYTQ